LISVLGHMLTCLKYENMWAVLQGRLTFQFVVEYNDAVVYFDNYVHISISKHKTLPLCGKTDQAFLRPILAIVLHSERQHKK
jgi:hypothetical protein